jgi:hypothetical protein
MNQAMRQRDGFRRTVKVDEAFLHLLGKNGFVAHNEVAAELVDQEIELRVSVTERPVEQSIVVERLQEIDGQSFRQTICPFSFGSKGLKRFGA